MHCSIEDDPDKYIVGFNGTCYTHKIYTVTANYPTHVQGVRQSVLSVYLSTSYLSICIYVDTKITSLRSGDSGIL